jgi:hypothetical protein
MCDHERERSETENGRRHGLGPSFLELHVVICACVDCNTSTYLFTKSVNECQEITTVGLAFRDFCPSSVPEDYLSRLSGGVNSNL